MMFNWDDLRVLLAVARAQTLIGAARELAVNQTTVGRRIVTLESDLQTRLFDRIDQRWVPTAAGVIAIRRAEQMESDALGTAVEIAGRDQDLSGPVRLTSVSTVINLLAKNVSELLSAYPMIEIELIDSQQNLDLNHLEADIALRFARPTVPSVVAARIGTANYHVYAARQFADQGDQLPWVVFSKFKDDLPESQWLARQMGDEKPLLRVNDLNVLANVVPSLPCRGLLPSARITEAMDLVNLSGPRPVVKREVWLVYLKALRNNARIAAVANWATRVCNAHLV